MFKDDLELLMKLQYGFPIKISPFKEIGEVLNLDEEEVISKIERYLRRGVIVNLGLQLNYRCLNENKATLVGLRVKGKRLRRVVKTINETKGVKHNYLRSDDQFNIWFTIRAKEMEAIFREVRRIVECAEVDDYVLLPTKRVYKLDVRYDLSKGISWSAPIVEPYEIPSLKELKVDLSLINDLRNNFKPSERPFKYFSKKYGISEEEIISIILRLIKLHVAKGFKAILSPEEIGFRENALIALRIEPGKVQKTCVKIVKDFPQVTHCVEREADVDKWNYQAYIMVHSKTKSQIFEVINEISNLKEVLEAKFLFSLANLRRWKLD